MKTEFKASFIPKPSASLEATPTVADCIFLEGNVVKLSSGVTQVYCIDIKMMKGNSVKPLREFGVKNQK